MKTYSILKQSKQFFVSLILFISSSFFIFSNSLDFIDSSEYRITPDERISGMTLSTYTDNNDMDAETFARTAFIASGATDDEIPSLMEKIGDLYNTLSDRFEKQKEEAEKFGAAYNIDISKQIDDTLHFLFEARLNIYSQNQTRVDIALTRGTYNCVSSTIIFMYLMKREKISVIAVETPLHSFCSVFVNGKKIDIETTNPWGFNPGEKKYISPTDQKNFVTVPAKNYSNRHNIGDRRILALIYNNRISALQKQKYDIPTVGLALDAMYLQNAVNENESLPFTTFTQCVNSAAIDYSLNDKGEKGLELTRIASEKYGDSDLYHKYDIFAVNMILNNLTNKKDFDSGFALLEKYKNRISEADYNSMYESNTYNMLLISADFINFEDNLLAIKEKSSILSKKHYNQLILSAYSGEADRIAKKDEWINAAAVCDKGLSEIPNDKTLLNQKKIYLNNYAVDVHNKAAKLFNSGDKDNAASVLRAGLNALGTNSLLENDLKRISK